MNLNDSTEGRWLTPDPAGLGAVDPTNPQSWNAYALNNPTTLTDPSGLGPQDDECDNGWEPNPACQGASGSGINGCGPDIFGFCPLWIAGGELNIGIASTGGTETSNSGPTIAVNPPAASPSGPFNGPNIGEPPGFESTADTIAQIGVYASPWEIEVTVVCASDPACLAVLIGAGGIAIAAHEGVLGQAVQTLLPLPVQAGIQIHKSKGGKQGVGHDYIREQARQLAKQKNISYCEALQLIYQAARSAGKFKMANDTKATQKEDGCRGH